MTLIRKRQKIKKWPDSQMKVHAPEQTEIMPVEGMPLVTPTRLMFENEELERVVYHMKDGRVISYETVDEEDE